MVKGYAPIPMEYSRNPEVIMITIKKILCPVDFFPASDMAVDYATGLALNYDAKIHLLHVVMPGVPPAYEYPVNSGEIVKSMEDAAAKEIDNIVTRVKAAGVAVESEVRVGDVHDEIKRAIDVVKPNLVVLGTHGRRGVERWFMGSTTERLLRHSPVPLLTISGNNGAAAGEPRFKRILVTTDFSEGTADALAYAFAMAQENDSRVTLLHVLHDVAADLSGKYREPLTKGIQSELEELVPPEAKDWCDVVTKVETGMPYRIILRTLEDEKVDLLVMNIHGKGMLDRALLGSTAERVVRAARCPVMLIPPLRKGKRKPRPGGRAAA
jgi:nucleotide-binding universal stress UspA family protein